VRGWSLFLFYYNPPCELKNTVGDDPAGSVLFLMVVVHECHRFLVRFPDPSLFFSRLSASGTDDWHVVIASGIIADKVVTR
jgi:hypothetical protein